MTRSSKSLIKGFVRFDPFTERESLCLMYKDDANNIEVRVSPFYGSNLYKFNFNGHDILYCDYDLLKKRLWTGCFIIWPLPNRVKNKIFEYEGKLYDLTQIKRDGNDRHLVHGLVYDKKWQLGKISVTKADVTASTFLDVKPGTAVYRYFPFASRLTLEYVLSADGLKVNYKVDNFSNKNLPFGFALHPYFPIHEKSNTTLTLPAKSLMESNNQLLPSGKLLNVKSSAFDLNLPKKVNEMSLDHVFTDLDRSALQIIDFADNKIKLSIETSEDFTHAVVYTKQKTYFCFENQTGSTDMINLYSQAVQLNSSKLKEAAHLLVIPPLKTRSGFVNYRLNQY